MCSVMLFLYFVDNSVLKYVEWFGSSTECCQQEMSDFVFRQVEPSNGTDNIETLAVTPGITHQMMIQGSGNDPPQVLQVLSLKDATVLTKAMASISDVKSEETIIGDQ